MILPWCLDYSRKLTKIRFLTYLYKERNTTFPLKVRINIENVDIYCIFGNRYLVLDKNNGKHQQYNFNYCSNVKAAENMQKNHIHNYIVDIVKLEKAINLKKHS